MSERDNDRRVSDALEALRLPETDLRPALRKKLEGRPPRRRRGLVAAVVLAVILVATAAAAITGYVLLVRNMDSPFSAYIAPVSDADEDQGIRVEVIGVAAVDTQLTVYFTAQDLEGDRLDGDTATHADLPDLTVTQTGSTGIDGYTAFSDGVLTSSISFRFAEPIADTVNFHIDGFSRTVWDEGLVVDLDLGAVEESAGTPMDTSALSGTPVGGNSLYDEDTLSLLLPGDDVIRLNGRDAYTIENIAVVGGDLQVLSREDVTRKSTVEFCQIYLTDGQGETIYPSGRILYCLDQDGAVVPIGEDMEAAYTVMLFPLEDVDLEEYALGVDYTYSEDILGNWDFTIDLPSLDTLRAECAIQVGENAVTSIQVSPYGVSLWGDGATWSGDISGIDHSLILTTEDGDILLRDNWGGSGDVKAFYRTEEPIDLDKVVSVTVYGETIHFK